MVIFSIWICNTVFAASAPVPEYEHSLFKIKFYPYSFKSKQINITRSRGNGKDISFFFLSSIIVVIMMLYQSVQE